MADPNREFEGGQRSGQPSVLAVTDFPKNIGRTERHIEPLTEVAEVTMVCIDPPEGVDSITFRSTPSVGVRPLDLLLMFAVALVEGVRGEYDAVVSFSLLPHGCFALAVGALSRTPTHLGIIGIDLDVHAEARYGPAVRWLFRRFDVVSVPGSPFAATLRGHGVASGSVERLINPVPKRGSGYDVAAVPEEATYDFVWVGRLEAEKDPLLFVEAMREVAETMPEFSAVILGDGSLSPEVERAVEDAGLADRIELAGWVDDPRDYYYRSRSLVITSERDALPLTLLEGMTAGLACIAPVVGNVPDVIRHEENGLLVTDRSPRGFHRAAEQLQDEALYGRITANAPAVRERYSADALTDDWHQVLRTMGVVEQATDRPSVGPTPTDQSPDARVPTSSD